MINKTTKWTIGLKDILEEFIEQVNGKEYEHKRIYLIFDDSETAYDELIEYFNANNIGKYADGHVQPAAVIGYKYLLDIDEINIKQDAHYDDRVGHLKKIIMDMYGKNKGIQFAEEWWIDDWYRGKDKYEK